MQELILSDQTLTTCQHFNSSIPISTHNMTSLSPRIGDITCPEQGLIQNDPVHVKYEQSQPKHQNFTDDLGI